MAGDRTLSYREAAGGVDRTFVSPYLVVALECERPLAAPVRLSLGEVDLCAIGRGEEPHYASLRAGDIVGEHTVQFAAAGERLELIHRATNRDIFARGALEAALRVAHQAPGRYGLAELMFPNL